MHIAQAHKELETEPISISCSSLQDGKHQCLVSGTMPGVCKVPGAQTKQRHWQILEAHGQPCKMVQGQ